MYFIHPYSRQSKLFRVAGAKAARLAVMAKHGIPVPDFRIISTKAFSRFHNSEPEKWSPKLVNFLQSFADNQSQLAVRSSAPFEDHASFTMAGLFRTILNVKGCDDAISAIRQCWSSLNSPPVTAYLSHFGFQTRQPTMAVILQKMLNPDYAGVLFTRHPVTGDERYMLLEMVVGIGEALVSGEADPVRILIDREKVEFTYYGEKEQVSYLQGQPGFQESLSNLLKFAADIETLFGAPQDIEWAVENNQVWILQSRPITHAISRQRVKVDENGRLWTDYFFAERFTRPLSPLGWSILQKWMEKNAYRSPLYDLGFTRIARSPNMTRLFNGLPYTHISVFQNLYSIIPLPFISPDKQKSLLLEHRKSWLPDTWRVVPFLINQISRGDCNWLPTVNLRRWQHFISYNKKELARLDNLLQADASKVFTDTESLTDKFLSLHRWSITFADVFYELLHVFLRFFKLAENPVSMLGDLLTGLKENETLLANLEFLKNRDDKLEHFIQQYGYRSESLDIYQPTWKDNSAVLQEILAKGKPCDLEETRTRLADFRKHAETACCTKLEAWPLGIRALLIFMFRQLLAYTQAFTLLRENQRNEWHKILSRMRDCARLHGQYLFRQGKIDHPDDVFFMDRSEFISTFDKDLDYRPVIAKRKAIHTALENPAPLPANGRFRHDQATWTKMEGFGVSKGIIRGRARIARNFAEARHAEYQEILIAHSADPAWSPIFSVISGLVLETGGILSHASVVAREFGLPTVTGIAGATHVIRDGDFVEIDGENGTVLKVPEPEQDHEH